MSGGSTSIFRHRTSAAYDVLSFPGAARHGVILDAQGGGGTGFPHVRWRLADQYGTMGTGSGNVTTEPPACSSSSGAPFSLPWVEDDGCEFDDERGPLSVSG